MKTDLKIRLVSNHQQSSQDNSVILIRRKEPVSLKGIFFLSRIWYWSVWHKSGLLELPTEILVSLCIWPSLYLLLTHTHSLSVCLCVCQLEVWDLLQRKSCCRSAVLGRLVESCLPNWSHQQQHPELFLILSRMSFEVGVREFPSQLTVFTLVKLLEKGRAENILLSWLGRSSAGLIYLCRLTQI